MRGRKDAPNCVLDPEGHGKRLEDQRSIFRTIACSTERGEGEGVRRALGEIEPALEGVALVLARFSSSAEVIVASDHEDTGLGGDA